MKYSIFVLLLAIPLAAQDLSVTYSRQEDAIPKAYVGTVPKTIAVYMATTCNDSGTEQRFFPDRIVQEASKTGPVEDGAAVIFAAQTYKGNSWKAIALGVAMYGMPMIGSGFAAAKAGTVLARVAAGAGGTAALMTFVKDAHDKQVSLSVPANWWTAGQKQRVLQAGECDVMLFAMSKAAPVTFSAHIGAPPIAPTSGVLLTPSGEIDVTATIMAARNAQADFTIAGLR